MPLFIDDRAGASAFTLPGGGSVAAVDEIFAELQIADVPPGLMEHLATLRQQLVEVDGPAVLPGLWSIQQSTQEVEFLQSALRQGDLGWGLGRDFVGRSEDHWVVEHDGGALFLGPVAQGAELALTDEDQGLVVPLRGGQEDLTVYYSPDFEAHERLQAPAAPPWARREQFWFEGFYMTGTGSLMGRIFQGLEAGYNRLIVHVAAGGGFLVGRVLHALGAGPAYPGDAFHRGRLAEASRRFPNLAQIVSETPAPVAKAVVFVHGTLSTSFAITRDLEEEIVAGAVSCFRFEHDTLRPINENARDLAAFIGLLETEDVLIVAHSRGGLVSATAVNFIRDEHHWLPRLWTFGSPHQGTPMAAAGHNLSPIVAMSLMARVGTSTTLEEVFRLGHVLGGRRFEGLEDMAPNSAYLQGVSRSPHLWKRVSTFAGDVASAGGLRAGPPWVQRGVSVAAQQVLQDPHDTVVEATAAHPSWCPQGTIYDVDHFSYFQLAEVRQRIRANL